MSIENLTSEQIEKAKACQTPEEFFALAEAEGIELPDEMLEGIAGGGYNLFDMIMNFINGKGFEFLPNENEIRKS